VQNYCRSSTAGLARLIARSRQGAQVREAVHNGAPQSRFSCRVRSSQLPPKPALRPSALSPSVTSCHRPPLPLLLLLLLAMAALAAPLAVLLLSALAVLLPLVREAATSNSLLLPS
jgi:hypothetical protein